MFNGFAFQLIKYEVTKGLVVADNGSSVTDAVEARRGRYTEGEHWQAVGDASTHESRSGEVGGTLIERIYKVSKEYHTSGLFEMYAVSYHSLTA